MDVVSVKRGVGPRGPWELSNVIDDQGNKYSTFKDYTGAKGKTITIEVEKKGNFMNIIEPKTMKQVEAQSRPPQKPLERPRNEDKLFELIYDQLARIEAKLASIGLEEVVEPQDKTPF